MGWFLAWARRHPLSNEMEIQASVSCVTVGSYLTLPCLSFCSYKPGFLQLSQPCSVTAHVLTSHNYCCTHAAQAVSLLKPAKHVFQHQEKMSL